MLDASRRRILTTGALGAAGMAVAAIATNQGQANSQASPKPQTSLSNKATVTGM